MSIVRVFYNAKSFDHVLMIRLQDEPVFRSETKGGTTALYQFNGDLIGYNIICDELQFDHDGYQAMSNTLLDQINQLITNDGYSKLDHDFTPYLVVGKVINMQDHPDSDHLHVCDVDVSNQVIKIVCGAHNVCVDALVVVAMDGAVLPDGKMIRKGKLRGVNSAGMLCSKWELGLVSVKEKGLFLLDDSYEVGQAFFAKG